MRTYTELTDEVSGTKVIQFEEGEKIGWIPVDEANSDYQAYLKRDEPQVKHLTEIPTGVKEL